MRSSALISLFITTLPFVAITQQIWEAKTLKFSHSSKKISPVAATYSFERTLRFQNHRQPIDLDALVADVVLG